MSTSAPMDTSVASLVNRYGGGTLSTHPSLPDRHGAAERGRFRNRSRDRESAHSAPRGYRSLTVHRANPAGAQERADWLAALETFDNRLEAVERICRLHGQSMAVTDETALNHRKVTEAVVTDIGKCKAYVENTFQGINDQSNLRYTAIENMPNIGVNEGLNALTD